MREKTSAIAVLLEILKKDKASGFRNLGFRVAGVWALGVKAVRLYYRSMPFEAGQPKTQLKNPDQALFCKFKV